jgi:hypothetical protein
MIIVLSSPRDEHAVVVLNELNKLGAQAQLLDLSEFPQKLSMELRYWGVERHYAFGCDQSGLNLGDCHAIWWRRPQSPSISQDITQQSHQFFALNECEEALSGLWNSLDVFWVNHPALDSIAHRKVYQLRVAQEVGLQIPVTLVTNCKNAALEFIQDFGNERVIYKSFSATEQEWRETRRLRKNELDFLENVKYAPVIFQEYIPARCDLRVTVVGDAIFPAAIYSQETSYKEDFRMDIVNARVEAVELPEEINHKLLALMRKMGVVYGAIDMRLTPGGDYVFLEINPAGQWLFIEKATQQPIATALAKLLHEHDHR